MFLKYFKRELKINLKFILIFVGVALGIGCVGGVCGLISFNLPFSDIVIYNVMKMLMASFYGMSNIGIALTCSAVYYVLIAKFYKTTSTDEAYLTFTLPMKNSDIFNAKYLSMIIYIFFMGIASLVSVLLSSIISSPKNIEYLLTFIFNIEWRIAIEIVLLIIAYVALNLMEICFIIAHIKSFGQKKTIITIIVSVLIVETINGIVFSIVNAILLVVGLVSYTFIVDVFLLLNTAVSVGLGLLCYFLIKKKLDKNLNLE